jgi:hypothetical protein
MTGYVKYQKRRQKRLPCVSAQSKRQIVEFIWVTIDNVNGRNEMNG